MEELIVRFVRAEEARPLRMAVLRPGLPAELSVYPLDDHPRAGHAGGFLGSRLVSVATVLPQAPPGETDPAAWRLRGVATRPDERGRGFGARVVGACLEHARREGGRRLWFSARLRAVAFYERLGARVAGPVVDTPPSGPHVLMTLEFSSPPAAPLAAPGGGVL